MSLIDRGDPEAEAKAKIAKALSGGYTETDRLNVLRQLQNGLYRLGMPFNCKIPTDIDGLNALHPAPALVAASQLMEQDDRTMKRTRAEREELIRRRDSMTAIVNWIESKPVLKLERNDCSRLHKLKAAERDGKLVGNTGDVFSGGGALAHVDQTFVIQHDWRDAFSKAEGISDEIKLPYDICAFEFRMGGFTLIATCLEIEGRVRFALLAESQGYWYPMCGDDDLQKVDGSHIGGYLWEQIRALCIALDAEVATHTVVRAPHALNEKRARNGELPLNDYRVVDLSRRHRISNPSGLHEGGRKRLHFRRGHWRHFETTKTWVRWCLVGNPDLGFIQKHYSL